MKDFDFCPGGCLFSLGSFVLREASCQAAGCKQPKGGVYMRVGTASYQQLCVILESESLSQKSSEITTVGPGTQPGRNPERNFKPEPHDLATLRFLTLRDGRETMMIGCCCCCFAYLFVCCKTGSRFVALASLKLAM